MGEKKEKQRGMREEENEWKEEIEDREEGKKDGR